ncbi:hybrid sensor histidine kinase/response regulator [Ohtaekwangia sp.]|uniref:hybrid sensor histidine kinase/response regulator n=1 Tax=Ohtaekwangia sp. TaxID=2066019 RepID=UPI002F9477D8
MEKKLKILMLEDREEDAGLINRMLKKDGIDFTSHNVDTRDEFVKALDAFEPDLILSDHSLPQFNSLEALKICQQSGFKGPFILVTGAVSEEFAVSCLKQGADDYVLKSNLARLPSAIHNSLRQRQMELRRRRAESALRKQNDELVKINKELDSFVYSVSHNLRAPLMSVLGLVQLAKMNDKQADAIYDTYFDKIEQSIHRLDNTLKEILDYSRNARSEVKIERVYLQKLIEDMFERLHYMEGSDRIEKIVMVDEQWPFYSDPQRLSVIFNNLISNAIKYRSPREDHQFIRIHIAVNATKAVIDFEDNGIGIPPELQTKIFDMFFRATELSEGAGLGLYIVKEAVDKLHGTIRVASTTTRGTLFHLEIPNNEEPVASPNV